MNMNIFERIHALTTETDMEEVGQIIGLLWLRKEYLESDEPVSEKGYQKWEDKISDLEGLIYLLVQVYKAQSMNQKEVNKIKVRTNVYQSMYGGLKRLKIE